MSAQTWGEVTLLVVCVLVAALASGTETAMTSVGRLRVRHLVEEGSRAAGAPYLTEEELMTLLHVSEEQGVIEEEEREMIHGIIQIGDKAVREVMVPRTDITAIPRDAQLDEIIRLFREYRHTRMPVFDGDLDHVIGLVNVK